MDSFRDQTTHVLHGSYQQLGSDLDEVFKQMVHFERSGEIDREALDLALGDARRSFEHWVEVICERLGRAGSGSVPPNKEPAPVQAM